MTGVSQTAIDAAATRLHAMLCPACGFSSGLKCDGKATGDDRDAARLALTAAAPHLARLLPAEHLALTVARAQCERGENPPINTTTVLVMALDRLTAATTGGDHD